MPLLRGRGSKETQRRSGDEMALEEEIADGGMYAENALCRQRLLGGLYLALSSSDHLV